MRCQLCPLAGIKISHPCSDTRSDPLIFCNAFIHLLLEQSQAALHNDVLQDGARRDHDTTAEVDRTSDGQVVKLKDLGDGSNAGLEAGDLLEVAAELDERSRAETVRQVLTGKKRLRGTTDSGLELDDAQVRLALVVGRDALAVGDDLHGKLVVLDHTLDGTDVHPDVVGVEVLELLNRLELVHVLLGHLSNFEQTSLALVVNDGTTLDISLGLVRQLHDVLSLGLNHVLQDVQVNDSAQVVGVGQEDDLNAALKQLVENTRVVERLEDVTVTWRVPVGDLGVGVLRGRKERVLQHTRVLGLVEGHDVDVVALVLLDDVGSVGVGVEGVHEEERHVDIVGAVQVLDLADGKVKEGHALTDLDDGLGANAAHGSTETTVELEHGKLVQEVNRLSVAQAVVVHDLLRLRRGDARPVDLVALGLVVQVTAEEGEEVVHLSLETLLLVRVLDGVSCTEIGGHHSPQRSNRPLRDLPCATATCRGASQQSHRRRWRAVEGLMGVYCVQRRLVILEGTSGTSYAGLCRAVRRTSDVKRLTGEDANVELSLGESDESTLARPRRAVSGGLYLQSPANEGSLRAAAPRSPSSTSSQGHVPWLASYFPALHLIACRQTAGLFETVEATIAEKQAVPKPIFSNCEPI
ncbi:putative UTP--glucose-1-phosphate [Hortaea werneckii]|nr:putative UTP--glucose-1-phosphate [Hortaea werneckii]